LLCVAAHETATGGDLAAMELFHGPERRHTELGEMGPEETYVTKARFSHQICSDLTIFCARRSGGNV
jgi:hypothetical protein